jgi:hypothetical protein
MTKPLRHLWLLLAGVLMTFSAQEVRASHAIGGDMSYTNIGPGLFIVKYRFYRDCSGISAPADFTLEYSATGCGPTGTGTNPAQTLTMPQQQVEPGNPYCSASNNASECDANTTVTVPGSPNYVVVTYSAIVDLGTAPNSACNEWLMSTSLNARPNTANIGFGTDLYTEVRLNTRLAPFDTSPAFPSAPGFQPLIFTCDTTYNLVLSQVTDQDNLVAGQANTDSLVYRSLQPLSGPGTVIPYEPGYSLANPVRVWTGTPPRTQGGPNPLVNYPWRVDPVTGAIEFTSGGYVPGSNDDEDNKFSISLAVESWRRTDPMRPNRREKISTVRRDILVVIFRCPTRSAAPTLPQNGDSAVINGGLVDTVYVQNASDTLTVDACTNAILDVQIQDINGDSLEVFISNNQLPGQAQISIIELRVIPGVFTTAKARLIWRPDASTVGGYYPVTIRLRDNGCPLPTTTDQDLILHVIKNQYSDVDLTGLGTTDTLCAGDSTLISALTRRPVINEIDQTPTTYSYVWDPDTLNTATILSTNNEQAIVRPLETTRYAVNVISEQGCIDTASVRIIVVPRPDTLQQIPVLQYFAGTTLTYGQTYAYDPRYASTPIPTLRADNDNGTPVPFRYRIRAVTGDSISESQLQYFSDTTSITPTVNGLVSSADFRLVQISSASASRRR